MCADVATLDALDQELWIWVRDGQIHVAIAAPWRDRVMLTATEARRVAQRLLDLATR